MTSLKKSIRALRADGTNKAEETVSPNTDHLKLSSEKQKKKKNEKE